MLHPDFPVVSGALRLPREWTLFLPMPFNQRVETEDMVLWRPGLRIWLSVWGNDGSGRARLDRVVRDMPGDAQELEQSEAGSVSRIAYWVLEQGALALHGFVFGPEGEVQLVHYCDGPEQLELARRIWRSIGPAQVVV